MRTPDVRLTFGTGAPDAEDRLRELILYIVARGGEDPLFGATKLNKILYYADFYSYAKFGKPITGVAYQKLENGPAPKRLLPVQEFMEKLGELDITKKQLLHGRWQKRFKALRPANKSLFTKEELELVDEIIADLSGKTAGQVSDESHMLPWHLTEMNELIPYEFVFLSGRPVTDSDREWLKEVAEQIQG